MYTVHVVSATVDVVLMTASKIISPVSLHARYDVTVMKELLLCEIVMYHRSNLITGLYTIYYSAHEVQQHVLCSRVMNIMSI